MAKLIVEGGATSFIDEIILEDDTVSTGVGKTGLAFGDTGMSWYYKKQGDAAYTAITLATMTEGTWATGGFIESDATNAPGSYEIGIPNAAIADGFGVVTFYLFDSGGGFKPVRWQYTEGLSAADINAEVDTALTDIHLDHFFAVSVADEIADNSFAADLVSATGDWSTFVANTDSLEAQRNNMGTAVDTDISTDISTVDANVDAILVDTSTTLNDKIDVIDGIVDSILVDTGTTLNDKIDVIDGIVDTILVDTAELQGDWVNGGRLDLILDARASQTTADAVETDTQDIQGRLPAALVSGRMSSDAVAISGSTTTADRMQDVYDQAISGTVSTANAAATTTTFQTASLTDQTADTYIDKELMATSGANAGERHTISDSEWVGGHTEQKLTFDTAWSAALANSVSFIII